MDSRTVSRRSVLGLALGAAAGAAFARALSLTPSAVAADGDAMVRIFHGSPDAPAVDIWVDGAKAIENLAFGDATDYVALPAGEHQVQVVPAGGMADAAVIDVKVTLEAGKHYIAAATGAVAEIKPMVIEVDTADVPADMARIQVTHLSPDGPAVDIAVKGGDVLVPNLAFGASSGYLEVPAGSYDLEVRPAGTTDVALPLDGVEVEGGKVYDVVAIGMVADLDVRVLVSDGTTGDAMAAPADAMLRVVHASPDAPAVDIWVNGEKAIEGLEFGKGTDFVTLPAGDYQVQVVPAGGMAADAVIDATVTLEAGKAYIAAAIGKVAEIKAIVIPVGLSDLAEGNARIQVTHLSVDAPAVDIAVKGGDVLVSNLEFGKSSGYLDVPAGTYDLEVRPHGTTDVVLDLGGTKLEDGTVYDVFAVGTVAEGTLNVAVFTADAHAHDMGSPEAGM